jgi:putative membrane protein insertion efficiency factor
MRLLLTLPLRAYRAVLSPMLGQRCRYYPSCSAYALESVEKFGIVRGSWLSLRRLGRCHPWTPGGVDLVPTEATYRWWGIADGADGEDAEKDSLTRTIPDTPPSVSSNDLNSALRGV